MTETNPTPPLRSAAMTAALSLLFMTAIVAFPLGYVFPRLLVEQDAAATFQNIAEHEALFRLGVYALLLVVILDVVAAWALYVFTAPVHRELALFAAWFRVIYSAVFAAAMGNFLKVLTLTGGAEFLSGTAQETLQTQVMLSLDAFSQTWNIGFVIFGLHLALLGYVCMRSTYVPKFLGIILVMAGASYVFDYSGVIIFPGYGLTVSLALGWMELIFAVWLLVKGGKSFAADLDQGKGARA